MPKVDHESAFNELWELATEGNGMPCVWPIDKEAFLARHTHRTEEDLPKDGNYWVRLGPGCNWFPVLFVNKHVVQVLQDDTSSWANKLNDRLLTLEIGPQILPPSETVNTTSR